MVTPVADSSPAISSSEEGALDNDTYVQLKAQNNKALKALNTYLTAAKKYQAAKDAKASLDEETKGLQKELRKEFPAIDDTSYNLGIGGWYTHIDYHPRLNTDKNPKIKFSYYHLKHSSCELDSKEKYISTLAEIYRLRDLPSNLSDLSEEVTKNLSEEDKKAFQYGFAEYLLEFSLHMGKLADQDSAMAADIFKEAKKRSNSAQTPDYFFNQAFKALGNRENVTKSQDSSTPIPLQHDLSVTKLSIDDLPSNQRDSCRQELENSFPHLWRIITGEEGNCDEGTLDGAIGELLPTDQSKSPDLSSLSGDSLSLVTTAICSILEQKSLLDNDQTQRRAS